MSFLDQFASEELPIPALEEQVGMGMKRWQQAQKTILAEKPDLAAWMQKVEEEEKLQALLHVLFGNSPFLTQVLLKEPEVLYDLVQHGADDCFERICHAATEAAHAKTRSEIMRSLRVCKRRMALLISLMDITACWSVDEVIERLSYFADMCVQAAVSFLLQEANEQQKIKLPCLENPGKDTGLIVWALGKLGSRELNYSSDIDLVVFYEPGKLQWEKKEKEGAFFITLARDLQQIISVRTAEGYVFRVDLRLRPDPFSTPPAIATPAVEVYYETIGQNWERAAMTKARFLAGDPDSHHTLMQFMVRYIWRKHLDFESIQDIHSMKRQIDSAQGKQLPNLQGYNVKLGHGGIREIEFFVQTQQLIWGGRQPELRLSNTCQALKALHRMQHVSREVCEQMQHAYLFYRKVEHRLQMIHDQQTHALPSNEQDMLHIARFMGYEKTHAFLAEIAKHILVVQQHYAVLFQSAPSLASEVPQAGGSLVFTGVENDPETVLTLQKMGFANAEHVMEVVRSWHYGRRRATRTRRARELLTELTPSLLHAMVHTRAPDRAFTHFDAFLDHLPSGVQIFSLFRANPKILNLIADIMGSYPMLANLLSRTPALLDYVLIPEFAHDIPTHKGLQTLLEHKLRFAHDLEDILNVIRHWTNEQKFRIAVKFIQGRQSVEDSAYHLSNLADVVLQVLLDAVHQEFARSHGSIKEAQFSVVALGRLGSQDMTFASDLDLIFIYDAKDLNGISDGDIPLGVAQYYARLSRRFITAITALTREGRLYEVDLRLRPSGNEGPIATSLQAFDHYYGTLAWSWEYLALIRARVVAGDEPLYQNLQSLLRQKITHALDSKGFLEGLRHMYVKTSAQNKTDNIFNIKRVAGGIFDLEYTIYYIQLCHGKHFPDIVGSHIDHSLHAMRKYHIVSQEQYRVLHDASRLYRFMLASLRLAGQEAATEDQLSEPTCQLFIQYTGCKDFNAFKKKLVTLQQKVQKLCTEFLQIPTVKDGL